MASLTTSEIEKANLKLIELVKKYECIWNRDALNYNQRASMDIAWNVIAKEMKDTSKACLLQWQKIRKAYSRSFRLNSNGTTCQKSEYYLASSLEFVRPHVNMKCTLQLDNSKKDNILKDTDDSLTSAMEIEIKDEPDDSDSCSVSTSENNVEHILFEIIKSEDDDDNKRKIEQDSAESTSKKLKKEDDSNAVKKPKEAKEAEKDVHPNSSLIDANRKFFESLIPFVDEMNTQQNRRFRREIMCLIDDVLDDKDINSENDRSS